MEFIRKGLRLPPAQQACFDTFSTHTWGGWEIHVNVFRTYVYLSVNYPLLDFNTFYNIASFIEHYLSDMTLIIWPRPAISCLVVVLILALFSALILPHCLNAFCPPW